MRTDRETGLVKSIDWLTIMLYVVLTIIGLISIYGAGFNYDHTGGIFDLSQRYGKQMLWIMLGGFVAICILLIDDRLFEHTSYYIYIAFVILLIVTLFVATEIKGSRSWISLGPINIQAAEFAKFSTALALAKYMSSHNFRLDNPRNAFFVILIIFVPFTIIVLQNETGSALVYLAFILVLFREGLPGIFLFLGFWAVYLFIIVVRFMDVPVMGCEYYSSGDLGHLIAYVSVIVVQIFMLLLNRKRARAMKILLLGNTLLFGTAILLQTTGLATVNFELLALISIGLSIILHLVCAYVEKERKFLTIVLLMIFSIAYSHSVEHIFENVLQRHQQMRIQVTLGIKDDPMGVGYSVRQSKISIGSGGFTGKGFLQGTQTKLNYVPEQDTDFIFCTVGEEFGFIGTSLVLLLYLALILRLMFLAERQRTVFGRVYGYCVACLIFSHVLINIGMVVGLTPVIGIPLPFLSYGGSSLWSFTIMLFVFLRIDMSRKEKF